MDDATVGATITRLRENVRILRDEISHYEEAREIYWPPASSGESLRRNFVEYQAFGAKWLGPLNKPLEARWEDLQAIPLRSTEVVLFPTLHDASVPRHFRGVDVLRKLLDDIGTTLRGHEVTSGAMPVAFAEVATVVCGWTPSRPLPNLEPYCRQLDLVLSLLDPNSVPCHERTRIENEARHSPDFASVFWYGQQFEFTTNQAACVKVLWEAWENKTPTLSGPEILEQARISQERLDKVFRGHPAWRTMIVSTIKGRYCLEPPVRENAHQMGG